MAATKLEIEGLRGFGKKQCLELGIPNGSPGSGLTILVGPNNSGKSTIIEAFRAFANRKPSFSEGKRNAKTSSRINLVLTNENGETKTIRTVRSNGGETEIINEKTHPQNTEIYVLPSRRYFDPFFGEGKWSRDSYLQNVPSAMIRGQALGNFYHRLFNVLEDYNKFNEVLRKVINPVPTWTIELAENGQYYLKFNQGNSSHSSEGVGDGIVSLFFIIDSLYDSAPGDMIVIDEPELSLHPTLQQKLSLLITDYCKDRQIILSTHSPYFLNFNFINQGAKIARIHLDKNFDSIISSLSKDSEVNISHLIQDSNNPHVFGLNAKEVFFLEDKIILVEGQEDVIFYKSVLDDLTMALNGEFFGWGVGGAEKMKMISKVLHDLGFQKVVGILDKNKAALIPELKAAFPEYHFFTIPADDIRTKKAVEAKKATYGLLDENKKVRLEYKDQIKEIFAQVNNHFNN